MRPNASIVIASFNTPVRGLTFKFDDRVDRAEHDDLRGGGRIAGLIGRCVLATTHLHLYENAVRRADIAVDRLAEDVIGPKS